MDPADLRDYGRGPGARTAVVGLVIAMIGIVLVIVGSGLRMRGVERSGSDVGQNAVG
jgi:hypothetical protein